MLIEGLNKKVRIYNVLKPLEFVSKKLLPNINQTFFSVVSFLVSLMKILDLDFLI